MINKHMKRCSVPSAAEKCKPKLRRDAAVRAALPQTPSVTRGAWRALWAPESIVNAPPFQPHVRPSPATASHQFFCGVLSPSPFGLHSARPLWRDPSGVSSLQRVLCPAPGRPRTAVSPPARLRDRCRSGLGTPGAAFLPEAAGGQGGWPSPQPAHCVSPEALKCCQRCDGPQYELDTS